MERYERVALGKAVKITARISGGRTECFISLGGRVERRALEKKSGGAWGLGDLLETIYADEVLPLEDGRRVVKRGNRLTVE